MLNRRKERIAKRLAQPEFLVQKSLTILLDPGYLITVANIEYELPSIFAISEWFVKLRNLHYLVEILLYANAFV